MSLSLSRAILSTIIYADVFDYPLTVEEIKKWLIESRIKNQELRIKNLKNIHGKDGYYFLKDRGEIVDLRKEKEKWSRDKLKIAHDISNLLKLIPTVKLVGVTGALAVDNAKKEDDIDLFIITSRGLLWTTRLLATLLIEITDTRRHPAENQVNNKICLNMFIDETHLGISPKEQDLFSAHEVLQMKLLWDRDDTYKKFIVANHWVQDYLPNAIRIAIKTPRGWQAERSEAMTPPMVEELITPIFSLLEKLLKNFQLWYMRNRRTTEVIKDGIIRFHPHDAREWVMKEHKARLSKWV